jgi:hypothetical protein
MSPGLAYLSYFLLRFISFLGYFMLILAPVVGMAIAESVRFVVRKRRSRALPWVTAIGVVAGMLVFILPSLFQTILYNNSQYGAAVGGIYSLGSILFPLGYAILSAATTFYRLKGIRL